MLPCATVSAETALPASAPPGAARAKVAAEEPQLELGSELKAGQSQCEPPEDRHVLGSRKGKKNGNRR